MRWFRKTLRIASLTAATIWAATAIFLTENATHLPPNARTPQLASTADASIQTPDGLTLRAWTREAGVGTGEPAVWNGEPAVWNGKAVILLHGVGDSHTGTAGIAAMFARRGYRTLSPDSRGHGASGGDRFSFGVRERQDVSLWIDWITQHWKPTAIFGHGASMGAAILLQSMPQEPRLKAVIADCPFATFRSVAYHRVLRAAGPLFLPAVEPAFLYSRLRFQIDLGEASPEEAMRLSSTPVLLIHGEQDTNIPIEHSERLLRARNERHCRLWKVPKAGHVASFGTAPEDYERHTIRWLEEAR